MSFIYFLPDNVCPLIIYLFSIITISLIHFRCKLSIICYYLLVSLTWSPLLAGITLCLYLWLCLCLLSLYICIGSAWNSSSMHELPRTATKTNEALAMKQSENQEHKFKNVLYLALEQSLFQTGPFVLVKLPVERSSGEATNLDWLSCHWSESLKGNISAKQKDFFFPLFCNSYLFFLSTNVIVLWKASLECTSKWLWSEKGRSCFPSNITLFSRWYSCC